jgi:hypothetical protein
MNCVSGSSHPNSINFFCAAETFAAEMKTTQANLHNFIPSSPQLFADPAPFFDRFPTVSLSHFLIRDASSKPARLNDARQ